MNIDEQNTLLKRAKMCLEDKDYIKADELCEKVLNSDPECAEAYFIKFLASQKVGTLNDILEKNIDISNDTNFNRATQFSKGKLKDDIIQYQRHRHKATLYSQARKAEITAFSPEACIKVSKMYEELGDFKDSKERAQACLKKTDQVKDDKKYLKKILIVGAILAFTAIVGHVLSDAKNEIDTVEKFDEANLKISIDPYDSNANKGVFQVYQYETSIAEKSRFKDQELVLTGTFISKVPNEYIYPDWLNMGTYRNPYGQNIPVLKDGYIHSDGFTLKNSKDEDINSNTYKYDACGEAITMNIFLMDDKSVKSKFNAYAPQLGDKLKVKSTYFATSYRQYGEKKYVIHRFIVKDILDVKKK